MECRKCVLADTGGEQWRRCQQPAAQSSLMLHCSMHLPNRLHLAGTQPRPPPQLHMHDPKHAQRLHAQGGGGHCSSVASARQLLPWLPLLLSLKGDRCYAPCPAFVCNKQTSISTIPAWPLLLVSKHVASWQLAPCAALLGTQLGPAGHP